MKILIIIGEEVSLPMSVPRLQDIEKYHTEKQYAKVTSLEYGFYDVYQREKPFKPAKITHVYVRPKGDLKFEYIVNHNIPES